MDLRLIKCLLNSNNSNSNSNIQMNNQQGRLNHSHNISNLLVMKLSNTIQTCINSNNK